MFFFLWLFFSSAVRKLYTRYNHAKQVPSHWVSPQPPLAGLDFSILIPFTGRNVSPGWLVLCYIVLSTHSVFFWVFFFGFVGWYSFLSLFFVLWVQSSISPVYKQLGVLGTLGVSSVLPRGHRDKGAPHSRAGNSPLLLVLCSCQTPIQTPINKHI